MVKEKLSGFDKVDLVPMRRTSILSLLRKLQENPVNLRRVVFEVYNQG